MKKLMLAVCFLSSFAFAQDLKPAQEEAKEKFETEIADSVTALNEKCGTKIVVKADFENFKDADWAGTSYSSYCSGVTDALGEMCASRPAYKKVLSKKLTGVSCLFSGVKPAEKKDGSNEGTLRNMSFEKGVFIWHMAKHGANLGDNTKATMEKTLN
jgi:hypothetical protein